ncbi:hypothetical protein D3C76_1403560 [compost metagenome]
MCLVECVQQFTGERRRQLRLSFDFLGIEGQLQDSAIIPVNAPLQMLKQASGVTESADNQLRQRCAVGGKLEVQHALGIARGFLRQRIVTLQQTHLPAASSEAGGRGTTGQPGTDHQRATFKG